MGADEFSAVAAGRDAAEAFRAAVDNARFMHGHGGYSGTIAEKHDFVHVAIPARVTYARFRALIDEAVELDYQNPAEARRDLRWHREHGVGARKTWGGTTLAAATREVERAERKHARAVAAFERKCANVPGLAEAVRRAASIETGDKWGPALCLGPITGKAATAMLPSASGGVRAEHKDGGWRYRLVRGRRLFVFSGMASS